MTATTDTAEPAATTTAEVKDQTDVSAVESSVTYTSGSANDYRAGIAAMTLAKGPAAEHLPTFTDLGAPDQVVDARPEGDQLRANVELGVLGDRYRTVENRTTDRFKEKYGVDVSERTTPDGKKTYVYEYEANGKIQSFKLSPEASEPTAEGMRKAEQEIQRQVMAKMRELENQYGVKIPGPGETIQPQIDICTGKEGAAVRTRLPTMQELIGLQDGLEKGQESFMNRPNGKPLSIYFADKPILPMANGGDYFQMGWMTNGKGIIISSSLRNQIVSTDQDINPGDKIKESFSSLFLHELGHETHSHVDFNVTDEFLKSMNMKRVPDFDRPGEFTEAIRDKEGKLYVFAQATGDLCNSKAGRRWYQVNEDGKPIDSKGNVVEVKSKRDLNRIPSLTSDELMKKMDIPATSNYFDSSKEIIAEGLKEFLRSPEKRAELFKSNRALHDLVMNLDQADIDRNHKERPHWRNPFTNRVEPKF